MIMAHQSNELKFIKYNESEGIYISSPLHPELQIIINKNESFEHNPFLSLGDLIPKIAFKFTIIIHKINEKSIEILDIAIKNPNFLDITICYIDETQKHAWQYISNILKNHHFETLYLKASNINNDEAYKILPYLNKINNISIDECKLFESELEKLLDNCLNVKNLCIWDSIRVFNYFYTKHIVRFVKKAKTENLNLYCKFQDDNCIMIIMALHDNKYIKKLYFEDEQMTIEILDALYELLKINKNIIHIDFEIRPEYINNEYIHFINKKLKENKQLLADKINNIIFINGVLMHSKISSISEDFLQFTTKLI